MLASGARVLHADHRGGRDFPPFAVAPDGQRVYLDTVGPSVSVLDLPTGQVTADVEALGWSPDGMAISDDGSRVYLTRSGIAIAVATIDTSSNTVVGEIPIHGVAFGELATTRDGRRGYLHTFGSRSD